MKYRSFLLVFLFLIQVSLIDGAVLVGNSSSNIAGVYGTSANLSGWVNLSFDIRADSVFEAVIGNNKLNMTLKQLLDDSNLGYNCSPVDCKDSYSASTEYTSKSINIGAGKDSYLGIYFKGVIEQINEISFSVTSNNAPSCKIPIAIDFSNDNGYDFNINKYNPNQLCGVTQGCFDSSEQLQGAAITQEKYCERVFLNEAPALYLGADIKRIKDQTNLTMSLLSNESEIIQGASCTLSSAQTSAYIDTQCIITSQINIPGYYFVCVNDPNADTASEANYMVRFETNNPCGFKRDTSNGYTADYDLSVKASQYDSIGSVVVNTSTYNKLEFSKLENYAINYLTNRYDTDCTNGCVVPLRFHSESGNNFIVDKIKINYDTNAVSGFLSQKINDVINKSANLKTKFVLVNLNSLSVPENPGNYKLTLKLDGGVFFEKDIIVGKVPVIKSLTPLSDSAGLDIVFNVTVDSENEITYYSWDFGDNSTEKTEDPYVTHKYNKDAKYIVKIEVLDDKGFLAKKEFNVSISKPSEAVADLIDQYKTFINKINQQSDWYSKLIKDNYNLDNAERTISTIEKDIARKGNSSDFISILDTLKNLKIPVDMTSSFKKSDYSFNRNKVSIENIVSLTKEDYNMKDREKILNALVKWNADNVRASISQEDFEAVLRDESVDDIGSVIKIDAKVNDSYLIIEAQDAKFRQDYGEIDIGEGYGIRLRENQVIEFFTQKKDAAIYLSPRLSKLSLKQDTCNDNGTCDVGEDTSTCPSDCKTSKTWIWVTLLIIAAGAVIAMFTPRIIKLVKSSQKPAFKNEFEKLNIINFIRSSQAKGMDKKEIVKKLKEEGWSSQQISYGFKNVDKQQEPLFPKRF